MTQTILVKGLRELLRVTDQLPKDVKRGVRDELRKVAEPVRADATRLFVARVGGPDQTRYGISVRKVGTVTVEQRRRRTTGKHPEFGERQMRKAMVPALERNEQLVVREMDGVLADMERRWGRR